MCVLSLVGVCLSFPRGRRHLVRVLVDVSLGVGEGEVVSVLAQRAQGKSTLLRVAAGMLRPDRGVVRLDGMDLWALRDSERARLLSREIALVSAVKPELDVPVLEGVALPLEVGGVTWRQAQARAEAALESVGVGDCAQQSWESLADWERALVAVARGVAREPRLLLVDDLTVSLGIEETDQVTRMLAQIAQERRVGVLMCASDARATGWSTRIATLAAGQLLAPEPPPHQGALIKFPRQVARRAR